MNSWLKSLITVFIVFNLLAIPIGTTKPLAEQNAIQRFFLPYLRWTRLLQSWPLFVPSPRKFAMKYKAEITFRDGEKKTWRRPYPPNWDFFQRHEAYNFQKWDLASNYLESSNMLWPDLVNYIERLHQNPNNPPTKIKLIREVALWPPPHTSGYVGPDDNELEWQDFPLFTYDVVERKFE